MSTIIERINEEQMRQDIPDFRPGDSFYNCAHNVSFLFIFL